MDLKDMVKFEAYKVTSGKQLQKDTKVYVDGERTLYYTALLGLDQCFCMNADYDIWKDWDVQVELDIERYDNMLQLYEEMGKNGQFWLSRLKEHVEKLKGEHTNG